MYSIANTTPSVKRSLNTISQIQNYTKMSENSTRQITLEELISSREASLVNHFPQAEKDLGPKTNATCGPKCLESFGRFPRSTSWAKTFAGYLVGQGDWYSKRCALTWKLKATKSHRIYFQLQVSALAPTEEIESGLLQEGMLPTPIASEIHHAKRVQKLKDAGGKTMASRKNGANRPNGLMDYLDFQGMLPSQVKYSGLIGTPTSRSVIRSEKFKKGRTPTPIEIADQFKYPPTMQKLGMLPTPTAYDWNTARTPKKWEEDKEKWKKKGVNLQNPLKQMASHGMLPTPLSSDNGDKVTGLENQNSLTKMARSETGKTSQLNPLFVEEMMGFPKDWTALPFQSGEKKV